MLLVAAFNMLIGGFAEAVSHAPQVKMPIKLDFRKEAEISRRYVYLEDVATCSGAAYICAEVLSVEIGLAPIKRIIKRFSSEEITALVSQEYPGLVLNSNEVSVVAVRSKYHTVSLSVIRDFIENQILEMPNKHDGVRYILADIHIPKVEVPEYMDIIAISGQNIFEEEKLNYHRWQNVKISFQDQSGSSERIEFRIRLKISAEKKVLVTSSDIRRGEQFNRQNTKLVWRDTGTRGLEYGFTSLDGLLTKRAIRGIKAGTKIGSDLVAKGNLVRRGQMVDLKIIGHGIIVGGKGKSLESGDLGQSIRIKKLNSSKILIGKVVGPRDIEVMLQ